ncbi:hypothetical protein B0T14DRAFT_497877 [Immersiella caudata]|uniref:Uncharacterized protein n=1 Tax=Immersiella caudata TaxID=314043 RepID=A0AA40BWZ0_9PEZI|nr:hypothetical protein B0T14DRAFT_497877 [Immersiella caudata]
MRVIGNPYYGNNDENVSEESVESPRYSADGLVPMLEDYYRFLATLHYDPSLLRIPGAKPLRHFKDTAMMWVIQEQTGNYHLDDFADGVLHRLPYFVRGGDTTFGYKSLLIDWTCGLSEFVSEFENRMIKVLSDMIDIAIKWDDMERWQHALAISHPYESDGDMFLLDTLRSEIIYISGHASVGGSITFHDVAEFFKIKKEEYRSLARIPCPGRPTMHVKHIPECEGHHCELHQRSINNTESPA